MNPLEIIRAHAGVLTIVIAFVAIVFAGAVSFVYLCRRAGFALFDPRAPWQGPRRAALAATLLVVPTIIVDGLAPFPEGINVPLPEGVLFYPLIAVVAEVTLHLLPLALLVVLVLIVSGERSPTRRQMLAGFALVACAEPALQVVAAWHDSAPWVLVYMAVQLFVFSLVQLGLFRRHGLVAMVALRLVYYLYWHIAWGYARLELLF